MKPKSPPRKKPAAPARVDSKRALADLQRAVWGLVSQPLTADNRMGARTRDGRATATVVGEIIKPNDRLTSTLR